MPVGAGPDHVEARAERETLAKREAAVRQLVVREFRLPQRSFERGEEPGERLLVVPDMRAAAFAGALANMLSFPAPEFPALQTNDGRAAQDAERARCGIE